MNRRWGPPVTGRGAMAASRTLVAILAAAAVAVPFLLPASAEARGFHFPRMPRMHMPRMRMPQMRTPRMASPRLHLPPRMNPGQFAHRPAHMPPRVKPESSRVNPKSSRVNPQPPTANPKPSNVNPQPIGHNPPRSNAPRAKAAGGCDNGSHCPGSGPPVSPFSDPRIPPMPNPTPVYPPQPPMNPSTPGVPGHPGITFSQGGFAGRPGTTPTQAPTNLGRNWYKPPCRGLGCPGNVKDPLAPVQGPLGPPIPLGPAVLTALNAWNTFNSAIGGDLGGRAARAGENIVYGKELAELNKADKKFWEEQRQAFLDGLSKSLNWAPRRPFPNQGWRP